MRGNVWRYLSKQGATRDVAGIYANWVRHGDPERTLQLLIQGWTSIRDTGRMSIQQIAPKHVEASLTAYPFMCPELAEMVKACGVDDDDVQVREVIEGGCKWKSTWR